MTPYFPCPAFVAEDSSTPGDNPATPEAITTNSPESEIIITETRCPVDAVVESVEHDLAQAIRAGVRPLRQSEWKEVVESAGFALEAEFTNDFQLLEPKRLIQDEGLRGAMRIAWNVLRNSAARKRVLGMRHAIRKHANHMQAIVLYAVKE